MAYTKEEKENIFYTIFDAIENGSSLRAALKIVDISSKSFYEWLDQDTHKVKQYARAVNERTDLKFDSIEQDYMEEPQRDPESGRIDSAWVQLQRLKIDAKKWELSKLNPKKYGDKTQTEHSGEITTNIISLGAGINPDETT